MTAGPECDRTRRMFPDLLEGRGVPPAEDHLGRCAGCAADLRAFRAVAEAAADPAPWEVPDPGQAYWDRFLPSVRARIAAAGAGDPPSRLPRWRAMAAAAAILLVAAASALTGPSAPGPAPRPSQAAADRLERSLRRLAAATSGPGGVVPVIAGPEGLRVDLLSPIGPVEVLGALDEIRRPPALGGLWDDEDLVVMVDSLDGAEAATLIAALQRESG